MKITIIKQFIESVNDNLKNFTEDEKQNFCEDCLKLKGDLTAYNPFQTDTGTCNNCGKITDVINLKITNLVMNSSFKIKDYHYYGGTRVFPQEPYQQLFIKSKEYQEWLNSKNSTPNMERGERA